MMYIAWEAKNQSRHNVSSVHRLVHARLLLKNDEADCPSLTQCGLLTILANLGTSDTPAAVKMIHKTDALQIWLQGFRLNYPCLDTLQIRDSVAELHVAVENRHEHDVYNQMSDPMDLDAPARFDSENEQGAEAETADDAMDDS